MGIFSFLKKKKKPEEKKGKGAMNLDVNLPPIEPVKPHPSAPETPETAPEHPYPGQGRQPEPSPYTPPSFPSPEQPQAFKEAESYRAEVANKDLAKSLDLLSAKLDAIKVMIENLNHRIDKLEQKEKRETVRW